MDTSHSFIGIADVTSSFRLNVGELEQLREFIRRHEDLVVEHEPGRFDRECLLAAVRIVLRHTRHCAK